jgi:hypothetical protein
MAERPALYVGDYRERGWRGNVPEPLPITRAEPLWRARQGRLIHRPLRGMIFLKNDGSYRNTNFHWLCGNTTNSPILVKPECMDGLEMCRRCEFEHERDVAERLK